MIIQNYNQVEWQQEKFLIFLNLKEMYLILLKFQGYWTRATLNRGIFPTAGTLNQVQLQTTLPGSTLKLLQNRL